jgi:plasmid stabilization system protein ParE
MGGGLGEGEGPLQAMTPSDTPIRLHPDAQGEFDLAIEWYERERPGLGETFAFRVKEVFERISKVPKIHGRVFRNVRGALVRQFPYAVYYRVESHAIEVLSVFHTKRHPREWQSRV